MKQKKSNLPAVIKKNELKPRGGLRPGSGRPVGARTILSRKTLSDHIGPETIDKIIKAIVEKAKSGDVDAIKYICNHYFGLPSPRKDANDPGTRFNILIDI